ncbi:Transmembrane protease serine 12 [Coemansia aciculifera]|uniref:Transmembrane protease serine 12 n=1 Tax=Coemansia aciculifera TaxID=417176 RepID=A0A9W8ILU6_9FUNG|nr:Transmembrane protease serine 12 [Coemansia aciculifera]
MRLLSFLVSLSLLAATSCATKPVFMRPASNRTAGTSRRHFGRVIGGNDAGQGQYPFAVFLMIREGDQTAFCGGSIISNRWILTAGHCVVDINSGGNSLNVSIPITKNKSHTGRTISERKYPTVKAKDIRVGVGNIYNARSAPYHVSKVYVHPNLNLDYFDNDIALIKLKKKLKFSNTVQPIKIDTDSIPDGLTVTGVGWGKTSLDSQSTADILQTVDLRTGNTELCKRVRPEFDSNNGNYICVTTPDGRDTCSGDSGGPLLRRCNADLAQSGSTGSGPWVQLGITSYGDNAGRDTRVICAADDGAGFYTHVARYLDYIKKTTGIKEQDLAATCNGNEL